jgi:O-antigen ligase
MSLFWIAASQVHEENDLTIFAVTTVVVSLVLSVWVIRTAAELDFTAYRGGIEVNENYVSMFVLAGAIPLVSAIFGRKGISFRFMCLASILCIVLASMILASRGMLLALGAAAILVAFSYRSRLGNWKLLGFATVVVLVFSVPLLLPGGTNLLERFASADLATLNDRTNIWSHSFRYFAHSGLTSMIFGKGLASSKAIISPMVPGTENYHNVYLLWLMEQGMVGFFSLMGFLFIVIRCVLKSTHPLRSLMIGWLAYFLVAGLANTVSDDHTFWIAMGVMIGASGLGYKKKNPFQVANREFSRMPRSQISGLYTAGGS